MLLVVDANPLFSFFKKESTVREIIIDPNSKHDLELKAPLKLFSELDKHKLEICRKAGISSEEYEFPRGILKVFIEAIPDDFWQDSKPKAREILFEHVKDVPYVALSLAFKSKGYDVGIWSMEKRLRAVEKHGIKVYSTSELLKMLALK
jgi:predicted nucleic acid-binding protein